MGTGYIIVLAAVALAIHIAVAVAMGQAMEGKGYGRGKVRAIGLVLCVACGFGGCIYVAALPDIVSQETAWKVLKKLEEKQ